MVRFDENNNVIEQESSRAILVGASTGEDITYSMEELARLAEAADRVRDKQQPDGTWLQENTHPGLIHSELEDGDGAPSRWNTLRALRALRWHDGARS